MPLIKILFYISNLALIVFYLYPGSIFGCFLYNDCNMQPQLTGDFLVSSNHVYVFFILSVLGFLSFKKRSTQIFVYLITLSIILELAHLVVPNRGFEVSDLVGNIVGVIISLLIFEYFIFRRKE
tara:strand:+ start:526 stop:897 length:372 start_codon:yes stop_codon:yes gene_type:complete